MARDFDLLGDPIPENHGKPGANGHLATAENVNKVRLLVAARWTQQQIADELGITVPTLNKHYFKNKSIKAARGHVISEIRGRIFLQLQKAADAGNVSAMKELQKIADRAELEDLDGKIKAPIKSKAKQPIGKKAQRLSDALTTDDDLLNSLPATEGKALH